MCDRETDQMIQLNVYYFKDRSNASYLIIHYDFHLIIRCTN